MTSEVVLDSRQSSKFYPVQQILNFCQILAKYFEFQQKIRLKKILIF